MNIICVHQRLNPGTRRACDAFATGVQYVNTPVNDDYAYWRAITSRWTGEEALVVIEQDIVIGPEVIPGFEACDKDWCTYAYPLAGEGEWMYWALGCVKFSARLQSVQIPRARWNLLDVTVRDVVSPVQRWPCLHGIVGHIKPPRPSPEQVKQALGPWSP